MLCGRSQSGRRLSRRWRDGLLTRTHAECRRRSRGNGRCRGARRLCGRRDRLLLSRTQAGCRSGRDRGRGGARRRRSDRLLTRTYAPRYGGAGSDSRSGRAGTSGLLGGGRCIGLRRRRRRRLRQSGALERRIGRRLRRWCYGWHRAGPLRCVRLRDRRHRAGGRRGSGRRNRLDGRCGSRRSRMLDRWNRCRRRRVLSGWNCCRRRRVLCWRCRCSRRMRLGGIRRGWAALLAGRRLAGALARRAALLVLRLGGLGHAPSAVQGNRRAGAVGGRDDGQHCCGDEERRSCHAVGSPGWIGRRRFHDSPHLRKESAQVHAAMPTTRQNYGGRWFRGRMVKSICSAAMRNFGARPFRFGAPPSTS
jgi:hypothetical protein